MRSGIKNIVLSQLRNGDGVCQAGWPSATCLVGLPRSAAECNQNTIGWGAIHATWNHCFSRECSSSSNAASSRPSSSSSPIAGSAYAAVLQRHPPVRWFAAAAATTSATAKAPSAPPARANAADPSASPSTTPASSSPAAAEAFPAGLAQLYPDPDAIPDSVMRRLRQQLFGRPIKPGEQTGRRALARPLQGRVLADWYFMPPSELPGFHNEEREYELSKALNRRHRKRDAEGEEAAGGKAGGKKK